MAYNNLPSLAYRIIEATVETPKGDAKVGRLVLDGTSERDVRDILSGGGVLDEKTRAQDYLRKALASGPQPTKDMRRRPARLTALPSGPSTALAKT